MAGAEGQFRSGSTADAGAEKEVGNFKFSATMRVDKNQDFDLLSTPAASIVWTPKQNNYLRLS